MSVRFSSIYNEKMRSSVFTNGEGKKEVYEVGSLSPRSGERVGERGEGEICKYGVTSQLLTSL
jgi:hypothetical protein